MGCVRTRGCSVFVLVTFHHRFLQPRPDFFEVEPGFLSGIGAECSSLRGNFPIRFRASPMEICVTLAIAGIISRRGVQYRCIMSLTVLFFLFRYFIDRSILAIGLYFRYEGHVTDSSKLGKCCDCKWFRNGIGRGCFILYPGTQRCFSFSGIRSCSVLMYLPCLLKRCINSSSFKNK